MSKVETAPSEEQIFQWIGESISRIPEPLTAKAREIATKNSKDALALGFNDKAREFLYDIDKMNYKYNGSLPVSSYISIFDEVKKINYMSPIEGASSTILIYTDKIFLRDESFFIQMQLGDGKVTGKTNFAFLRSAEFKRIWGLMTREDKDFLINKLITMTMYVYSYYIIISSSTKKK